VLDPEVSYRALRARDERFDGRLFVGVTSTGIYCRPICPARPASFENCRFFPSAAAAQAAGFRPCLRCRPELAPHTHSRSLRGSWRGSENTVSRGLALIAEGALDGEGASVCALAERLGVGERQLRRLFRHHLGATPVAVAQTRRVLFAKQLIVDTRMTMAEIAIAAGYGSLRRFNEAFQELFCRPPSALRRSLGEASASDATSSKGVTVRLRYRPPYDWAGVLAHLRARAIEGVEHVGATHYCRTVRYEGEVGTLDVTHSPEAQSVVATIRFPSVRALSTIVARVRRMFDLNADVSVIGAHLQRDPLLAPFVRERPGLRLPGSWDGFEAAVRAILGQQISLRAGRALGARLVRICETDVASAVTENAAMLSCVFPSAEEIASADLSALPMPSARKRALAEVARAARRDPFLFEAAHELDATVAKLVAIPGIGPWTAQTIALRSAGEPDAFPEGDAGLLRALTVVTGAPLSGPRLRKRAERWRPWRGYAAQHLWSAELRP
jgi:AraC family transcriptional regulator of adaptative response / DNA-3-methyladenine glycosylase II